MTQPTEQDQYVLVLEAVVAVLALKCGLNPNTMMGKAIEDITEQAGLETLDTERLIRERWTNRPVSAAALASDLLPGTLETQALRATETVETVPMATRVQAWRQRQSEASSDSPV